MSNANHMIIFDCKSFQVVKCLKSFKQRKYFLVNGSISFRPEPQHTYAGGNLYIAFTSEQASSLIPVPVQFVEFSAESGSWITKFPSTCECHTGVIYKEEGNLGKQRKLHALVSTKKLESISKRCRSHGEQILLSRATYL